MKLARMHEGVAPEKVRNVSDTLGLVPRLHLSLYVTYTGIKPASSFAVEPGKVDRYLQIFRDAGFHVAYPVAFDEIGISRSQDAVSRLAKAPDGIELGLALGYPADAVYAFTWQRESGHGYWALKNERQLATAVMENVPIPTWLAYLNHCSVTFDPLNGHILDGSRRQGIEYMVHVRETNPRLAHIVEADFAKRLRESLRREAHFTVSRKEKTPEVVEYTRAMTEMRRKSLYGLLRKPIFVDAI